MQKVRQSSAVQNVQIRDSVFLEILCVEISPLHLHTQTGQKRLLNLRVAECSTQY